MQMLAILGLLAAATAAPSPATQPADETPPEVRQLVQKLAGRDATARDAARDQLAEIGGPAVAALKAARDAGDASSEARQAAEAALRTIGERAGRDQDKLRPKGNTALNDKHFAEAALAFDQLTLWEKAEVGDWLGLARAREGLEHWPQAAAAYQGAIRRMDARLALTPQDLLNERLQAQKDAQVIRGPVWDINIARSILEQEQKDLRHKRLIVHRDLGCIERDRLKDAAAAERTFRAGLEGAPANLTKWTIQELDDARRLRLTITDPLDGARPSDRDFHVNTLVVPAVELLRDLAVAQEQQGKVREAIDALTRAAVAQSAASGNAARADVPPIYRLLRMLKPSDELPPTPMLHVLTPAKPSFVVDFSAADDVAAAKADAFFWQFTNSGMRAYWFYVAAPPGKAFEQVEVSVDMERKEELKMGYGIRLVNWNGAAVGSRDSDKGRKVVTRTFKPPAGKSAELLHLEVMGTAAEPFTIHQVKVTATLRNERSER